VSIEATSLRPQCRYHTIRYDILTTESIRHSCNPIYRYTPRYVLELAYIESFVKVANFNLPHLDLALPLGVTPFEFDLRHQKKN